MDLKILLTRRKILFNILAKLIDLYVVFTDTDTIFRNAYRKRSCRRFVRNQGLLDTVVNDYSEERFKYTSGPFNYYVCTKKGKRGEGGLGA